MTLEEHEAKSEYLDMLEQCFCRLNNGSYYEACGRKRWIPVNPSEMKNRLAAGGFPTYLSEYKRGMPAVVKAELEDILRYISEENRIDYAGPLAGRKTGIREFNGTKILVTESPKLVIPEKGDWSGIRQIFERMFGPDQIDYFYSWYKRVLKSVLSGNDMSLHFFAMCGPVNSGKTWLQEAVISEMLGGYGSPNQYMSEGTPFNADLFRTPHQMLSDAKGSISFEKRRAFGSFVKDIVANSGHRCHGKGEKALELDPIWVATCSCNTSPIERLRILPPLEADIRDKMIITLITPGKMPIDTADAEGREEFRVWTKGQLPAFAWWLLNGYSIPAEIALPDRFGIKGYCHPKIERYLLELSPDARVRDYIQNTLFCSNGQGQTWRGSNEELTRLFNTEEGRRVLKSAKGRLCDILSRLMNVYPKEFIRKKNNDHRFWILNAPVADSDVL
jgi:hypothetical protein